MRFTVWRFFLLLEGARQRWPLAVCSVLTRSVVEVPPLLELGIYLRIAALDHRIKLDPDLFAVTSPAFHSDATRMGEEDGT